AGFLGVMYYFLPKQANLPLASQRLAIFHFWSLILLGVWAGPHYILFPVLPEWTRTLGITCSLLLLIPAVSGVFNGIMTLKGHWDKLKSDPILQFMITALICYGLAAFDVALLSTRTVDALSHYTDWASGHVHGAALGWVTMLGIGTSYFLIPRLWGMRQLKSQRLLAAHFWLSVSGLLLYCTSMVAGGIKQGLQWQAIGPDGSLAYSFLETVRTMHPFYVVSLVGGLLLLAGMCLMVYNVLLTMRAAHSRNALVQVLPGNEN
ncbi:MAG: cbb3-type cytochrome c oxidase subunit I, partial [Cyanobacteria bacterium NC_groundwater_1444_Ag_S-0.65um_54_12]|nr:cbb3-type cytochrome c oxidase subunit I [Cyanobacteria bacterium NC_groundwater_1444_Ag_S-0.65um_54_12]